MSGKQYKDKRCVYCGHPNSDDGDHIICRSFFFPQHRNNLPKVPSCRRCNYEKSKLEHYLTSVLPFGSGNTHAGHMLETMVQPRLVKNVKLHKNLIRGKQITYYSLNGSPWEAQMSLPFDGGKLLKLYEFITKGLVFYHWGIYLTDEHITKVGLFTKEGEDFFERLLAMNGNRVSGSLGNGTFSYEGVQSHESPFLSVWRMSLYGAEFSERRSSREFRAIYAYAITAPKKMPAASKFVQLLGMK